MPIHAVLATLITRRPLCLSCIAAHLETTLPAADKALTTVSNTLRVSAEPASRCRGCGEETTTYCIGRRPAR